MRAAAPSRSPNYPPAHRGGVGRARLGRSEPDRRLARDRRRNHRASCSANRAAMAAAARETRSRGAERVRDPGAAGRRSVRAGGAAQRGDHRRAGECASGLALRREDRFPPGPAAAAEGKAPSRASPERRGSSRRARRRRIDRGQRLARGRRRGSAHERSTGRRARAARRAPDREGGLKVWLPAIRSPGAESRA